jgi:uroporphyrinogen decarboxylase
MALLSKIFWKEYYNHLMKDLFLQALQGRNTSGPPVWLMRQAGRHLASYRALRQRYSFLEMCHEPDLITQVTLLPIETYDVDAAILFSDILVIPEAMGVGVHFEDRVGPIIERPVLSSLDIEALPPPDPAKLQFVAQGIRQLKSQLKVPLIGFCGAPFTVVSYMIEGKISRDLKKTKSWMLKDPQNFHALLRKIAEWSIVYLLLQIDAGVDAIQIFDSWANVLAHHSFREFSLAYMQTLLKGISHTRIPTILFCRGSSVFAPQLAELQPSPTGISLDWNCQMAHMRQLIPHPIALQGNLDPHILYAPLHKVEEEVYHLLNEMEGDPGFIFNLGHGVHPDVSEEAVRTLVACVKGRQKCQPTLSS